MGDIRVKSHSDSDFPSLNTFQNRVGIGSWLEKTIEYCSGKKGYDDILSICQNAKQKLPKKIDAFDNEESKKFGHVYLLKSGNHYKIGRTDNVERRFKEITIALPEVLSPIHQIRTDDPSGIEAYWHKRFKDRRVRPDAEWFELKPTDIAAFKQRKFM